MESRTLTLTGNSAQLQAEYFPSIDLSGGNYVCGLIDFQTFNSIPNIDETNNLFYFGYKNTEPKRDENEIDQEPIDIVSLNSTENSVDKLNSYDTINDSDSYSVELHSNNNGTRDTRAVNANKFGKLPLSCIEIPTGSYEVEDLAKYLKRALAVRGVKIELESNKNTLKCEIMCSQPIDFTKPNSIGTLLGFRSNLQLKPNQVHISQLPADILKVNVIRVECNIIAGSFLNNKPSHTIHQFSPRVPPGYKIIEAPQNVIYFPVTVKNIHTLNLTIIDQENNSINFRGETITVRLHIKKVN